MPWWRSQIYPNLFPVFPIGLLSTCLNIIVEGIIWTSKGVMTPYLGRHLRFWVPLYWGGCVLLFRSFIPDLVCVFSARKAIGSNILRSSVLVWNSVSDFLFDLAGLLSSFNIFSSGSVHWLHSRRLFVLLFLLNLWRRYLKFSHCPFDSIWLSLLVFDCMRQNLALGLMSLPMLYFSMGLHIWDGWSGSKNLLHICSAAWYICPWFGIGTMEEVNPFGPPICIVLVPLPFWWSFPVFLWCAMGAC